MGPLKIILSLFFLLLAPLSFAQNTSEAGRILFLIQQGQHDKGLELYQQHFQEQGHHDYALLHQIGLGIVEYGFKQKDPETQLLALFGASVSAHEDAYHIIEDSLKSPFPPIQLIALNSLERFQSDRAEKAIYQALSSNNPLVRLEAVLQLCKKKDPQAINQAETLMYKFPKDYRSIFPQLFAMVESEKATRLLRKLLNDPDETVRLAAILSIAKYKRDDLLPQIRQVSLHINYAQQEAAAYTLGLLKDEQSAPQLIRLTKSQYPNIQIAALLALYQLGKKEVDTQLIDLAKKENLFAIAALGEVEESIPTLIALLQNKNLQVRVNATLSLLKLGNENCFLTLKDLIIRNKHDLAFTESSSPGKSIKSWKAISSASQILKDDLSAYVANIELREDILRDAAKISEKHFYVLAEGIFQTRQNDLIPVTIELLEEHATKEAIQILKKYHQKVGAPLVRNYCNLALYRLKEEGPYGELLRQWVKNQYKEAFIRFRPFEPWQFNSKHELTPEETSRLLIESFETFAKNQDNDGVAMLIEAIRSGHEKNKFALAGLLIRATQ